MLYEVITPYPGAFSYMGHRKCIFWSVSVVNESGGMPGTVLSVDPFVIACGKNALRVDFGQPEGELSYNFV